MSQITARHEHSNGHAHPHDEPFVAARKHLDLNLVTLKPGSTNTAMFALIFAGLVACVVVVIGAFTGSGENAKAVLKHAMGAYHTGFMYTVGLCVACLGMQMILQQVNAGWSATVRRQCETIASLAWVVALLFLPIFLLELFVTKGTLFKWMNPEYTRGDPIYEHKQAYLNVGAWTWRAVLYFGIWIVLGSTLYKLSRRQDDTGDRWLTARARWISSFGLLLFALSAAFASFDWLMSLDYHWFSTMFGVYFFAGSTVSALALLCVILCTLRIRGKLGPAFTQEHQHDLGKLLFAFTVFWAYVTLCQYFLIWYSNIPEETLFFITRKDGPWRMITIIICAGHFAVPFLLLLIRDVKRNPHALRLVGLWMLVMHALDLFFLVRPIIEKGEGIKLGQSVWVDVCGILGPVCLFLGMVVWKMGRAPLIPIKDPRLHEVLAHKNYV